MSPSGPIDVPTPDCPARARALIEGQIAMLARLAEIGMAIAEAAGRRAAAEAQDGAAGRPEAASNPALEFARVARAVRMTIALQARLAKDLSALDRAGAAALASEADTCRERVQRQVERVLGARCEDEDEAEQLASDAWERLTDEDDADLAARPVAEVVARICRDLGLSPEDGDAAVDLPPLAVWPPEPTVSAARPWARPGWADARPTPGVTAEGGAPRSGWDPIPLLHSG